MLSTNDNIKEHFQEIWDKRDAKNVRRLLNKLL